MVVAGIALSLTFQAQLLALAHPCQARFGAANASERPWRTAKRCSADLAFEIRGLFECHRKKPLLLVMTYPLSRAGAGKTHLEDSGIKHLIPLLILALRHRWGKPR